MNRQKLNIGQMFLVGFDGITVGKGHPVVEAIQLHQLGGVILFDRNVDGTRQNIRSPEQLRELNETLQKFAEVPLIIAIDQEGGKVCRLKEKDGFPSTVSARQLGEKGKRRETYRHAGLIASILAQCGINMNLAPVVDLDLNLENPIIGHYDRSFGKSTEEVVSHASVFIKAHHEQGIACCLKHFPGHGSAAADSHLGFVDITEHWQDMELEPYVQLFATGFADSVMTAHVVNRQLDAKGLPATLSEAVIGGLLRKKLGFNGVTISDDLQMKAITNR
ncbi:MAG: glycoside hydrolase family 3 N-terminal domain-containing protein, partial [Desulfobulbales bacterium]